MDGVMQDGITIRAYRPEDADGINALDTLPSYRAGTLRLPHPSIVRTRERMERYVATDGVHLLVAVAGTIVVGSASLDRGRERRAHAGQIGLGVHDLTRRGIGRALLAELVAIADRWLDLRRLELTVWADNAPAIALYEQFGFAVEGRFADYAFRDGIYVDALAMARRPIR